MTEKKYSKYIIDISDDDILSAMKEIEGYIDITLSDFKELYFFACNHAAERLIHSIVAEDIMTKNVISVKRGTPLEEVAAVMSLHGISGVPVTGDEGDVIGVISEKDFLLLSGRHTKNRSFMDVIAQGLGTAECITVPLYEKKAEDIMTSPAITVGETTPVSDIMTLFTEKNINRVPVLSQDVNLVGIVSRADVLRTPFPKPKE